MIIIHSSVPFISLQPLTVVAAIQLCVAVKTLYLMSIYTGTMRLNLMFHHWDHCWCARGWAGTITLVIPRHWPLVWWADSDITPHSDSGVIIAILRQQFAMQGGKHDAEIFIQNVKGGHTFPLPVWAFLDWPNGRPAVRHSPHQIQLTHCELSVDKLTLHTVDQYLCLPSETHPVKLFKLAVFKQLQ